MFIHPYPSQINCRFKSFVFFLCYSLTSQENPPHLKISQIDPPFPWENPIPSVGVAWIFPGTSDRPLNFAWKIVLPETLANEKLYRDDNSGLSFFNLRSGGPSSLSLWKAKMKIKNSWSQVNGCLTRITSSTLPLELSRECGWHSPYGLLWINSPPDEFSSLFRVGQHKQENN